MTIVFCIGGISGCTNLGTIQLTRMDGPPIYCVSKENKCVARLFGGLHVAPNGELAATPQLLTNVDQTEHIYFEVLNFDNPKFVNALDYISAEKYRNRIERALESTDIPDNALNEEYLTQLERVYYGADILSIAPVLFQIADKRCDLLRRNGTEVVVQERAAGTRKTLYSMETSADRAEDFKLAPKLRPIQNDELTSQSKSEEKKKFPRDEPFVQSIIERTCENTRKKWLDWRRAENSKTNDSNSLDYGAMALRNRRFTSFILTGIGLNHFPLVIVGKDHLQGEDGLITLLKKEGFHVTVAR